MTEKSPFAAVRETHIGVVFLVGDRAYKLKKPVELGFLESGTPERRHAACLREVELNRRLAPDVHLGVATVSDVDEGMGEPMVVMRRMPDDRGLSALVRSGVPLTREITRLDASWSVSEERDRATAVAERTHSTLVRLRCAAAAAITEHRLRTREGSLSDADPAIALAMAADEVPWPEATDLDTSGAPEAALTEALRIAGVVRTGAGR